MGATEELTHTVFPHSTLSESMHESVLAAFGRALNFQETLAAAPRPRRWIGSRPGRRVQKTETAFDSLPEAPRFLPTSSAAASRLRASRWARPSKISAATINALVSTEMNRVT